MPEPTCCRLNHPTGRRARAARQGTCAMVPMPIVRPVLFPFLALLAQVGLSWGQAPAISTLSPMAIAPGQTLDVAVSGTNLAGATELWSTFGDRAALSPDVANNGQ